ncbi:RecQ family ATP-dependent DNA helicase [Dellaglioa carnosa]|uniref:RecQ family ATP-dependent DNA helicase n=1 Tax=Dellaglioa carnosa TaxID=2995136 RepID=UPI0022A89EBF|nr:RecQ family ATP-dependent DNA helicase [Dellaglioa carnosa]MCZ2492559.1 RecQ family ATP-dependent DNA helicase [Dellaglioa carnosa]
MTTINLKEKLSEYFGFESFMSGQEETIKTVLSGQDTLSVLPTGTGKSLCYQLAGYLMDGTTIIVSPLLSLIQDQVSQFNFRGNGVAIGLTSLLSYSGKKYVLKNINAYKFIYLSPEMLSQVEVTNALKRINVSLFVVDEAHCISTWGPDFRPDYLNLNKVITELGKPLILALTATATPRIQDDIVAQLKIPNRSFNKIIRSVNRENIFLSTIKVNDEFEKNEQLLGLLNKLDGVGIVYFSSKKKANEISELINRHTELKSEPYHADLTDMARYTVQQQFMMNQIDVICATSAFGMGINKKDIRYVIHYHMPANFESYVQEFGRAGRDGQQSIAIVFSQVNDLFLQRGLIDLTIPDADFIKLYFKKHAELVGLGEEKGKLLDYYYEKHDTVDQVQALFRQRKIEKEIGLQNMMAFIDSNQCRKQEILRHFGESKTVQHDKSCCSIIFNEKILEVIGLKKRINVTNEKRLIQQSETIMTKLFQKS